MTSPSIVFDPAYDIGLFGLERLHPFDSRKYGRAWGALRDRFEARLVRPPGPVGRAELALVHDEAYLERLRSAGEIAAVLEIGLARFVPAWLLDRRILGPMRWATAGTIVAAGLALEGGEAIHLGGGYHHAKPGGGEGFCVYADVALAIETLRGQGRLGPSDQVVYVDLDAHLGNGVATCFAADDRVRILDAFNAAIYPCHDVAAIRRVDVPIPLAPGTDTGRYLAAIDEALPAFLDRAAAAGPIGLAVYNAGTDILEGDPLGGLAVSADGVLERDRRVLDELRGRDLPTVLVPSGGYSPRSHELLARTAAARF